MEGHDFCQQLAYFYDVNRCWDRMGCRRTNSSGTKVAPSARSCKKNYSIQGKGCSYDCATDDNFARLREGELKSGRIAMLAVLETVAVPLLHRMTAGYSYLPPKVWDRVTSASPSDAIKVVLTCWILETFVLVQRDPKDLPGDYGLGYFGVRDKGLHESSLIAELEHGRLAMMALVVQLSLERFFDMSWDEQWALLFKRWADQL